MDILIGLCVGILILGIFLALYDWVCLGMPFGKRKRLDRKLGEQELEKLKSSNADEQPKRDV